MGNLETWETKNLGDLAKLITGKTPPTSVSEYFGHSILWVTPADFKSKEVFETARTLTQKAIDDKKCNVLPANCILLNCIGDVGKVSILRKQGSSNQQITAVLPKDDLDVNFLYYLLLTQNNNLKNLANEAVVPILNNERLKTLKISFPPIPTQKRIAEILDKADALRKKDKQLLQYYNDLAQSLFINMFGDPVRNEKGWDLKRIGEITTISSGSTPSRDNPKYFEGDIPWVKTTEVNGSTIIKTEEYITQDGLTNSSCKLYPVGSIIIAMYGQGKTRGQVGILGVEATTNQACGVVKPNDCYNSAYLYNYLKMSYTQLRALGRGGNQENLNAGMIKNYEIMLPPITLQNEFAQQIQNIEQQKEKLKVQMQESENLFQALLQQAFNDGLN